MISLLPTPSTRVRLTWLIRLLAIDVRGRGGTNIVCVCAFAVTTLAIVVCVATFFPRRAGVEGAAAAGGTELVAFLREDLPEGRQEDLAAVLGRLPGVAGVRLLASEEALARMRAELGDRSSVLDGVEEGFLPATLEVSLQPGPQGSGHADAIAWRLRRMEGIAEVDVLRTTTDERLARAADMGQRFAGMGFAFGSVSALLAMGLAVVVLRRRPGDAQLLGGLGFTTGAIVAPATITGAACGAAGTLLGMLLLAGVQSLDVGFGVGAFTVGRLGVGGGWSGAAGGLAASVFLGAGIGWWGARPSTPAMDDLAPAD